MDKIPDHYKKILIEKMNKQRELYLQQKQKEKQETSPPSSSDEKFIQKTNIFEKAKSFGSSMISRGISNKKALQETKTLRIFSCHGSEEDELPPCSERKNSSKFEGSFYCGACGCGDRSGTQLTNLTVDGKEQYSKLDYPKVSCPLKMPGFSTYIPSEEGVSENTRKKTIENKFGIDYIKQHSS